MPLNAPPDDLGYRMPAEWEPHQSTWISWPHNEETWPHELRQVESTIAEVVRVLSRSETVRINVNSEEHQRRAVAALDAVGAVGDVRFHVIPTNDAWVRDYGPIFVLGSGRELAATVWGFNSWGGKYPPYDFDDAAARKMAEALAVPVFDGDMILEGGSVEVNGEGVLATTESCLLNKNRNPHLGRVEIENRLRRLLGAQQVIWLREGIAGDDTDGHIDDVARFVTANTMVAALPSDTRSDDYDVLKEGIEILRSTRLTGGESIEVVELPMPSPIRVKGERMPATYANYYVGNRTVIVPTYDDPNDERAISILRRSFPTRDIVGIDCRELIWGLGAVHCLTQQVPRGR